MHVGLALSGGGAIGAAHIGVLEQMEEHHVRLDSICGTSAGAIVGLLYADGGINAIFRFLNLLEECGLIKSPLGLLARTPERIWTQVSEALSTCVEARSFEDLRLPFSCVATDIVTGSPVVIDSGDPIAAVKASAAYPSVFAIQRVSGSFLVDGGITRNLPADIVRKSGADFVIGSSLYRVPQVSYNKDKPRLGRVEVALRVLEIMELEMSLQQIKLCDFCFQPPVETYRWYDFDRIAEILQLGRSDASRNVGTLLAKLREHPQSI
ncbi:MAG: hypothetical protein GX139_02605 [Armatimonadetes bacterium]|jgi:NTE family protein|nr:hypothetical protein [Armatimonadota bacterium]